jgi:hypothetical protein
VGETFVECRECGFIYREDQEGRVALDAYAGGECEEVHASDYLGELRRSDARVRLDFLSEWCRGGRLLDVGTASGAFVSEALARGARTADPEPRPRGRSSRVRGRHGRFARNR